MENNHFQWENPLFQWSFSIAMLNYQRVLVEHGQDQPKKSWQDRRSTRHRTKARAVRRPKLDELLSSS